MPSEQQNLLTVRVSRVDASEMLLERINLGYEIKQQTISSEDDLEDVKVQKQKWSSYNMELLRRIYSNDSAAQEYGGPRLVSGAFVIGASFPALIGQFHREIQRDITCLESLRERLDLIPEPKPSARDVQMLANQVFIVHGHDNEVRQSVARFIEKLDLQTIILDEQPSKGRTVIEKFEDESVNAGFAIVLLTPDDVGTVKTQSEMQVRARQNVIFEMGYFAGKLGRGCVCLLRKGDVEMPSDLSGIVYVSIDEAGGWKLQLAREMKAAGLDVDLNKAI